MKTISKVTGALMIAALFAFSVAAQAPAKPTPTPKPARSTEAATHRTRPPIFNGSQRSTRPEIVK